MNNTKKLIGYIRVSTQKQGDSGLGLEGQLSAIQQHARTCGGVALKMYREVESGKRSDRPELDKAIQHARQEKATLVIAKLDRLARNVHFVSGLMEANVDFVACDNPNANRLTVHILAAVAEEEARQISNRTKAALTAAKARGTLLGSARPGHWEGREDARLAGAKAGNAASVKARLKQSAAVVSDILPDMKERYREGQGYRKIARFLNNAGHPTVKGCKWTAMQVKRVLLRELTPDDIAAASRSHDDPADRFGSFAVHKEVETVYPLVMACG